MIFLLVLGGYLYMKDEKLKGNAEADAVKLAELVARCGEPLPESTQPVPAHVPGAKPYKSSASDWAQPAFACKGAKFSPRHAQHYRFKWVKESAGAGRIVADGDADYNGEADTTIEVRVSCSGGSCAVQAPSTTSHF